MKMRAIVHKPNKLCYVYNYKPSFVPCASKPHLFVGFCSRKAVETMDKGVRVVQQGKYSSSRRTYEKDAFVEDLSKIPSEFYMPQHQFEAILNHLSKWISTAILVVFIVWKWDGESLWMAMGSVVNYIICVTLKRVLKEERPVYCSKSDPGMPSSHAQSIFFILTSIALSIIERFGENIFTLSISALAFACASYLSWLRVSQQFHTRRQVIVGGAVGSIFAVRWFRAWHSFVFQAFTLFWWVRAVVFSGAATFFLAYLSYILYHAFTIIKSNHSKHNKFF